MILRHDSEAFRAAAGDLGSVLFAQHLAKKGKPGL